VPVLNLNKDVVKKILLIVTVTLLLYFGLNHFDTVTEAFNALVEVLSPFLLGLCFAFVINVLMRPLEKLWDKGSGKSRRRWPAGLRRPVCMLLSILVMLGVVFIVVFMLIPQIEQTVGRIANVFPDYMTTVELWWNNLRATLESYSISLPAMNMNISDLAQKLGQLLSERGNAFLNTTVGITTSIFKVLFNIVLGLIFSIYVLSQKEKLAGQCRRVIRAYLPARRVDRFLEICQLVNSTFTKFVTGQLTEAVIIGCLCFLGMTVLRLPYAPMISVLIGFTALIPVYGSFIGTGLGAFFILMDTPVKAVWFVGFIIVLQQLEGNLIYPKVVGKSVGLPGIWVLTAVTIGGSVFGFLGMLISVPVCSVLYSLLRQSVHHRLDTAPSAQKPTPPENNGK